MLIVEDENGGVVDIDDLIKRVIKKPLSDKEFKEIDDYFNDYKRINYLKEMEKGHIYDKNEFDYYMIFEHSSWYVKLVMKRSIAHLVNRHRIPDYMLTKKLLK